MHDVACNNNCILLESRSFDYLFNCLQHMEIHCNKVCGSSSVLKLRKNFCTMYELKDYFVSSNSDFSV